MKAVRMVAVNQPLELHEIPIPEIGDDDLLVRVRAAGICHSDVHYRAGRSPVRESMRSRKLSIRSVRVSHRISWVLPRRPPPP